MNRGEFIDKLTRDLSDKGFLVNEIGDLLEVTYITGGSTKSLSFTKDFLYQIYEKNTYKLVFHAVMEAAMK